MVTQAKNSALTIFKGILQYIVWLGFTVSQMGLVLWAHEQIVTLSFVYAQKVDNPWLPRAVDQWSMVLLGIPVLAAIFVTEAYLKQGMQKQCFWRHVGWIALIEALVALALYGSGFLI